MDIDEAGPADGLRDVKKMGATRGRYYFFFLPTALTFLLPCPIWGKKPSCSPLLPFPLPPTVYISGIQSLSFQVPPAPKTPPPPSPPSTSPRASRRSALIRRPSSILSPVWNSLSSSRRTRPEPPEVWPLEEPGLGAGIEYWVPRSRYWKLGFRWTMVWTAGVLVVVAVEEDEEGVAADTVVMDVRSRVGPPHEGQNFFDGSLQSLKREGVVRESARAR